MPKAPLTSKPGRLIVGLIETESYLGVEFFVGLGEKVDSDD